jgi:hypothetical protein
MSSSGLSQWLRKQLFGSFKVHAGVFDISKFTASCPFNLMKRRCLPRGLQTSAHHGVSKPENSELGKAENTGT